MQDEAMMETLSCRVEKLLDQREVAKLLGVSSKTLEYWRWKRIGPRWIKLGRLARYRLSDVIEYIQALTREAA